MNHNKIETPRLFLRTLTNSDVAIVREINGDEFKTDKAADEFIRWQSNPGRFLINFYVWLKQADKCIGRVYVHSKPELDNEVEIGYSILTEYRNKGYATEAAKAVVRFAFEQAKLDVLCAIIKFENIASQCVIDKLGFSKYGVRKLADENNEMCEFNYFKLLRTK